MSKVVSLIIAGAGDRGGNYIRIAEKYPDRVRIAAIAEPRDYYRNTLGDRYQVPPDRRFRSWEEAAQLPKFADAVIIATPDDLHEAPAIAFAGKGYHLLLEKPLAPTEEACRRIAEAVRKAGVMFAVCHELRYTCHTQTIKKLLEDGTIGDLMSVEHLEPVGYWHQAHSFVRGNWRNEKESCFMLLAKCCHDLDWLRYVIGVPCRKVQSFGSLKHFRKEKRPAGAAARCTYCPENIEKNCPYSAIKIYLRDRAEKGHFEWPLNVLTSDATCAGIRKALETGPYGRCVYACDNDVVDHQVVNLLFDNDCTVSMTMTAFVPIADRKTRLFGTRGCIETDSRIVKVHDFLTDQTREINTENIVDDGILASHCGAALAMMEAFVKALETGDRSCILSGVDDSLESHLMVFAAERSRKKGSVEPVEL